MMDRGALDVTRSLSIMRTAMVAGSPISDVGRSLQVDVRPKLSVHYLTSTTTPDWIREHCRSFWDPGRRFLNAVRRYDRWSAKGSPFRWLAKYWLFQDRFWSLVTGAEIPLKGRIEGGLRIPPPNGTVIHSGAVLEPNCLIFRQVTLGEGGRKLGVPVLGGMSTWALGRRSWRA